MGLVRRIAACSMAILLLTLSINSPSSRLAVADQSSALRMTVIIPPNSMNEMTMTTGSSGYLLISLMLLDGVPGAWANGTLEWTGAMTDWIKSNSNFTQWMFNVKPGLKWSDGTPVNASDILATFGPKFALIPNYDIFGIGPEIAKEYALNSSTAVFDLNVSDSIFDWKTSGSLFTQVYPAELINKGAVNSTFFQGLISDGPFILRNYTSGSFQMVLVRNPYFQPQPKISEIDITFVEDASLGAAALLSGSTDIFPSLQPSNVAAILKNPSLSVETVPGVGISSIEWNVTAYPYNMTEFRQAITYGINQSQIVAQSYGGYALPAWDAEGAISPVSTVYYNSQQTQYSYNVSKALQLFSSIGITKGSDGYLHYQNGSDVSETVWTDTDNPTDLITASIVRQNLAALGIKTTEQTASAANIVSDYVGNVANIRAGMLVFSTLGSTNWGVPFDDINPGWNIYWLPVNPQPHWEYPPSADAQYNSNVTAFYNTTDPTLIKKYLSNVQLLNSAHLPTLVLAYPDVIIGYNHERFTGWNIPMEYSAGAFLDSFFENLTPVSSSTNSSSSSSVSSTSSLSGQPTTSTTPPSSSTTPLIYTAIAVVVIVVLASLGIFAARRRRPPSTPPSA